MGTVTLSKESQKQIIVQELMNLGITEYKNQPIGQLDYYTLRDVLAIERINK